MSKRTAAGRKRFWHSFGYAAQGIAAAFKSELNMKVHTGIAVAVLGAAAWFRVPLAHWLLLLLSIMLVFSAELMNTAVESVVDLVSPDYHPLAKKAKDTAAGAVLLTALFAVCAGAYVFYRPAAEWLAGFMARGG